LDILFPVFYFINHHDTFKGDYEEVEVGFVDGLFELYKLRELILKSKEEIL